MRANSFSETLAADSTSEAESDVLANLQARLHVATNADLTGSDTVKIMADQSNVKTVTDATSRISFGLTGTVTAISDNTLVAHTQVDADPGSKISTKDLYVESASPHFNQDYEKLVDATGNTVVKWVFEVIGTACSVVVEIFTFGLADGDEVCEAVFGWVEHLLHSDENEVKRGSENRMQHHQLQLGCHHSRPAEPEAARRGRWDHPRKN